MPSDHPPLVRTRLSIMMFLEFFVWGSWGVAITGYAAKLGFGVSQIGWLGAVPAVGAIISPLFVGLIADRFFPAQRMEYHHVVNAVDELRPEMPANDLHHGRLHGIVVLFARHLLDHLATEV